ncbi:MAG: MinD/ParA family protein [Planctomycetota bacterium]
MSTIAAPRDDQATRLRAMVERTEAPAAGSAPRSRKRARTVCIASGKGGVGKTCLAVGLSTCFAEARRETILVDADLGLGNADLLCGVTPRRTTADIVAGVATCETSAVEVRPNFRLIPGASGDPRLADIGAEQRLALFDRFAWAEREAEVLLMDCGAGVGSSVLSFLASGDLAVIVTTPEPTSIADAYALIKCLIRQGDGAFETGRIKLVVNGVREPREGPRVYERLAKVCDRFLHFTPTLLGCVRHDMDVARSVCARTPIVEYAPRSHAAQDVRTIGERLARELGLADRGRARRARRTKPGIWARVLGV